MVYIRKEQIPFLIEILQKANSDVSLSRVVENLHVDLAKPKGRGKKWVRKSIVQRFDKEKDAWIYELLDADNVPTVSPSPPIPTEEVTE